MEKHRLPSNVEFTTHAIQRMSQRGISWDQAAYVFKHGRHMKLKGQYIIALDIDDIPLDDRARMEKAAGVLLRLDDTRTSVISVMRKSSSRHNLSRRKKAAIRRDPVARRIQQATRGY